MVKSKRGHVTEVRQQFSNVAGQVVRLYDATVAGGVLASRLINQARAAPAPAIES